MPSFPSALGLDSKICSSNHPLANPRLPSSSLLPSLSNSNTQPLIPALSTLFIPLPNSLMAGLEKTLNRVHQSFLNFMTTNPGWALYLAWQPCFICLVNQVFHASKQPWSKLLISPIFYAAPFFLLSDEDLASCSTEKKI